MPKDKKSGKKVVPPSRTTRKGAIYLGGVPRGFLEPEIRNFFKQLGKVTRVRVSRNKKTGHSKHYAFVEFADEEVAQRAAKSMNGYILYDRILKAKFIPHDAVPEGLFKNSHKKFNKINQRLRTDRQLTKDKTAEELAKKQKRQKKISAKRAKRAESAGFTVHIQEETKKEAKKAKKPHRSKADQPKTVT
ncbi:putative MKI67 FHA domain-interacting nucleolar phosphoprotein [Blattamonas nauphoetae]|uniref:MKI67 FHA domain-interacting nucleolar phosphoprotein n=1 Tax=Blattamonas nauphoetae TaxID=2049346 RepID=A0ABQ9YL72_9EUKA|nr:putative MKI67 FHA domain-interacting nucleolar phosphoprotein [Blattamonas nauphoetae]